MVGLSGLAAPAYRAARFRQFARRRQSRRSVIVLRDFGFTFAGGGSRKEGSRAALPEPSRELVAYDMGCSIRFAELLMPTLNGAWCHCRKIVDKISPFQLCHVAEVKQTLVEIFCPEGLRH